MIGGKMPRNGKMEAVLEKTLEKAWNSSCRVIFGRELTGGLSAYRKWLCRDIPKPAKRKSHESDQELDLAVDAYPKSARFVSEAELKHNRDYSLSINDIKDIDSIARALAEKCEYTGSRFLGNSAYVEGSDIVMDSQYVNNSTNVEESTYVDSSFMIRKGSKYVFGSGYLAKSELVVRVIGTFNSKRCFECYFVPDSADAYFSHACFGSQNIMFCFGQRNVSHRIGNLQLAKDAYMKLKAKLLSEVCGELERKKEYPLLRELVPDVSPAPVPKIEMPAARKEGSMAPMEKGFASTCSVLFRKNIGGLEKFEKWLSENTVQIASATSAFGTKNFYPLGHSSISIFPIKRRVSYEESIACGSLHLEEKEAATLEGIISGLGKIGYFTSEMYYGENSNYIDSPLVYHGSNVYKLYDITYGENAAVSFLALNSKYVYGCRRILESQFSMKCYNSLYLNRCFEMDSCNKCSDSYFCHNSEALTDSMFCFNMKGRRHNIGNTQLSKEEYAGIKDSLVQQMADELAKTGGLKRNIYNIGAKNE